MTARVHATGKGTGEDVSGAGNCPLLLVTKAGGFGTPDYLVRIRGILEKA